MPTELRREVNPFESPVKTTVSSLPTTMTTDTRTQEPDVLATADLLLEQLKELENLCSTVEERVQRKRRALKELEYLILGPNSVEGSPRSPICPANTPIGSRLRLVSPRLRGLFDLRGPGQANLDSTQSCLDYSPEMRGEDNVSTREDPGHSDEWVDDDDALLSDSPFDDKYALRQSPQKVEKTLPPLPCEGAGEVLESKIPRKVYVRREVSVSRRLAGRPSGAVVRGTPRRRSTVRNVKATHATSDLATNGTMRRGSWKRSVMENGKAKGAIKISSAIENGCAKDNTRRKEKRKGIWSIYSVCSDLGLSGTHHAV